MVRPDVLPHPGSEIQARLIALFLLRPEKAWHRSELVRSLDVTSSALQRSLDALESNGVLLSRPDGNRVSYMIDERNPNLPELRSRSIRTVGIRDLLRDTLAPYFQRIHMAFLYGASAIADGPPSREIEMMIIGSLGAAELVAPLRELQVKLGRPVNATVYSLSDFDDRRREGHTFLTSVLNKPRVMLVGTEGDMG